MTVASSVLLSAFGLVAARLSYARATDAAMMFGEQLRSMGPRQPSGDLGEENYEVLLNGQPVESSNAATRHPMHDVLDYFEAECEHDAEGLGSKFAHLDRSLRAMSPEAGSQGFLVVRREQDDRGFVFCLAVDGPMSYAQTLERLKLVGQSGDIAQLGDVRYASVRKDGKGSEVFTMWGRGAFNVVAMFPSTGDVPGEDFGGVPRPDGGRRVLSGTVVGASFGINSYQVLGAPDGISMAVDAKLLAAGWRRTKMPTTVPEIDRFYSLGDSMDIVVDVRETHPKVTNVSYVVSRGVASVSR